MSKADKYQANLKKNPLTVPDGALGLAQVIVFDDESIHVSGPSILGAGEEYTVATLQSGLELMGYRVTLEPDDTLAKDVTVHHPLNGLTQDIATA